MMMMIFMMVVMTMIIHKRMLKALSSDWMLNDSSSQRKEGEHCSDQLQKALRLKSIISLSFLVMMMMMVVMVMIVTMMMMMASTSNK